MSPTIDKLIAWGGAITLLLAGALGIQSGWPRPSEEMDNGRLVILGLSGLSSLAGLLLFLALVAHRWVPAESPGNRLARVFRPMIDRGQMLYQDAGLPNAYPDVHGNFDGRVGRWESEAGKAVARYAGEYQDVFQTAISGDIYVQEANSGPIDLGAQHRRLYRALAVLRGLVEAVPPSQIHFAAPDEAIEGYA